MKLINMYELETIIENIIQNVPCSKCQEHFTPQDLSVMAAKSDKCVIAGQCPSCSCPMAVTVNVSRSGEAHGAVANPASQMVDSIQSNKQYAQNGDTEYLKDFNGDFIELFGSSE